ncbi:hypothetical protein PRZ60_27495 [Escherichia coli]|nr:hypothetical protein [Escherichia coli]
MTQEAYNIGSLIVYVISAVIALIMLGVAISQLSKLRIQVQEAVKSNIISELGTFLEVENQIKNSRRELTKASLNVLTLKDKGRQDELDSASLYLDECIENYLNGLDRLCFCIIKEYFDNDDMKIEYRHVINDAVEKIQRIFSRHQSIEILKRSMKNGQIVNGSHNDVTSSF